MTILQITVTILALLGTTVSRVAATDDDNNSYCGLTDMLGSLKEAHASCDSCGFVTQVLVREIEERVKLHVSLDQRLLQLGENLEQHSVLLKEIEGRVKLQVSSDQKTGQNEEELRQPSLSSGSIVAFSARVNQKLADLTRQRRIVFGEVLTNIGNAYNGETGEFRCPVSGLYQFIVTILSNYGERIETEMIAAETSRMLLYSGSTKYHGSGTNSVYLQLNAGDIVYVRVYFAFGNYVHHYWSTFNGLLVREF